MFIRSRLLVFLFIILAIVVPISAQNEPALDFIILSEPVVDDTSGMVMVQFVVEDNGIPIVDLNSSAIELSESAENIQLSTSIARSLTLAIPIDLSFGSDADLVRDTLHAFFDNYYLPQDHITLYILDAAVGNGDNPRIVPIDSLETANTVIDGLKSAERLFSIEPTLIQVFADLQTVPDTSWNSRQVLLVGSFLNRPAEANTTEVFALNNIAVHGVQAHRTRQEFTTTYRGLTNTGGGLFANNFEGIFVIPGEKYQPVNNLKVLYDTIGNSRIIYTLIWHTVSQSLDTSRSVILALHLPVGTILEQEITYTFNFQPPQVTLVNQRSFDVQRRTFRLDDLSLDFDLDERAVPVEISFPDGVPRRISSLRLQVVDAETHEILQSELVLEPELTGVGQYILSWQLIDYITPDSVTNVQIIVTVNDELGLSNSVVITGSVQVSPAPPIPTATPTMTPMPTQTPTPEPTAIPFADNQSGLGQIFGASDGGGLIGLLLAIIVVLFVAVLLLLIRSRRFQQEAAVASVATTASTSDDVDSFAEVTSVSAVPLGENGYQDKSHRFAQLVPVNGTQDHIKIDRIWLDRREYTIGRATTCDFVIDSPILNDEHCRISVKKYDEIYIRDLGSVNGTYINGERLQGSEEVFVPMGSELGLTKELTFELWQPDKAIHEDEHFSTALKSSVYSSAESVPFKPLPGVRYARDDGPSIDDNYSPI